jgi:hypothetical protein
MFHKKIPYWKSEGDFYKTLLPNLDLVFGLKKVKDMPIGTNLVNGRTEPYAMQCKPL